MASSHYVNNPEFLAAIKTRKLQLIEAEETGGESPQVSEYIGECILSIAQHLSYKSNFINYSFKDEMISDGIENCLKYIDNFDPDKSSNPFAYFTQIIFFAFLRRIAKEKRQTIIKGKLIRDMSIESFEIQEHDEDGHYTNSYIDFMLQNGHFVELEEKKSKVKKNQPSLEDFIGE